MTTVAYGVREAAQAACQSVDTIRRALRATDPAKFPPPLRAKKAGRRLLITHTELERWVASLPDA